MKLLTTLLCLCIAVYAQHKKNEGNFRIRRRVTVPRGNPDPITGINRPANMFLPSELGVRKETRFAPRRQPLPPAPQSHRPAPSRRGPPAIRPPKGVAKQLNQATDFRRLAFQLLRGRFVQ